MKLSYRGVNYDFNPSSLQARGAKYRLAEVSKARALGAILTYRGSAYAIKPSTQTVSANAGVSAGTALTYRGQSYTVQPTAQALPQATAIQPAAVNSAKAPVFSIQDQARALTMNHHRAMKKRQQVMLVRSAAEVGMSSTASHWERLQETFNPVFQATYDRSHVGMS
ncbi:DUF4278 domain-containing protein [Stenomitos frigidus]|uniref:DUF4278 domain-containing protein n=1 Tax=Stenomitos frigidus ULC18 TaxID=2107698 RepID=A0A2T1ED48_9CYAN|nr:DUF4278 domain-containing protein [Stenomitos frigidus]PSB30660.1 hypothetical protein C7B82_08290 [Stenomitos frigidus ULC18]